MMTGLVIFLAVFFTVIYVVVGFITFLFIETVNFMAHLIVGRKWEDETLKSLLFAIFWPITIPFAIFMAILEVLWELFKKGCGWISRL